MKRVVLELWVADDAADEMTAHIADADLRESGLVDGEKVLGVRIALPDGNVVRVGETWG